MNATIVIPEKAMARIDRLIKGGFARSRSEFIRTAALERLRGYTKEVENAG